MAVVRIDAADSEETKKAKLKEIEKAKQSLKATREAIKRAVQSNVPNPDH